MTTYLGLPGGLPRGETAGTPILSHSIYTRDDSKVQLCNILTRSMSDLFKLTGGKKYLLLPSPTLNSSSSCKVGKARKL